MKFKQAGICLTLLAVTWTSIVQAQPRFQVAPGPYGAEPMPLPTFPAGPPEIEDYSAYYAPDIDQIQPIAPFVEGQTEFYGQPMELYNRVVYRHPRQMHPHAVPYLVEVPLPPPRRRAACRDCRPPCALVKICVPPCKTPCVRVRRCGYRLCYDFGKYEVYVAVRRCGRVIVSYSA